MAAGGRRVSRFPDGFPSPSVRRRPATAAVSAIGRPTARSAPDATRTPRSRGRPGSSWPGSCPARPPGKASGRSSMFSPLPAGARVGVTHDNGTGFARHTRLRDEPGMDTYFADPYSSRRRGSNENRNGMIRRHPPERSEIRMDMAGELREIVSTRPTTVPCACSATARPPRHSPTNHWNCRTNRGVAPLNRHRALTVARTGSTGPT